jgi:hypothetical protein
MVLAKWKPYDSVVESQKSYIRHLKSCIFKYKILGLFIHCQLVLKLDASNLTGHQNKLFPPRYPI